MTEAQIVAELGEIRKQLSDAMDRLAALQIIVAIKSGVPQPLSGGGPGEE